MNAIALAESYITEADFFQKADAFWEQLEKGLVVESANYPSPLQQICEADRYSYLMATADQLFTQEVTLAFLGRLRRWAKDSLGARHASTPQIHLYHDGCHRALAPDASPTRWHYLYSLTRGRSPAIRLLETNGQRKWFGIILSQIANLQLGFNQLLVHGTNQAYGLDVPSGAATPLEGAVLLHGYLW